MIEDGRVVHEVRYPHAVDSVWRALTDPAALASWLMPNDFVATVGQRFRFDATPGFGIVDGEVLDVDAPRLLPCRWTIEGIPTTVTFRLRVDGADTVLRLEHDGLPPDAAGSFDGGWGTKFDHDLRLALAGDRDPAAAFTDRGLVRHPDLDARP